MAGRLDPRRLGNAEFLQQPLPAEAGVSRNQVQLSLLGEPFRQTGQDRGLEKRQVTFLYSHR